MLEIGEVGITDDSGSSVPRSIRGSPAKFAAQQQVLLRKCKGTSQPFGYGRIGNMGSLVGI